MTRLRQWETVEYCEHRFFFFPPKKKRTETLRRKSCMNLSRLKYKANQTVAQSTRKKNRVDFDGSDVSLCIAQGMEHWTCEEEMQF